MAIRFLVALVLFALLLYFVDVSELLVIVSQIDLYYIVILLLISVVMIWASCLKWQLFVRAFGSDVSILHLMNFYTIGYFFNTFTPSYVGGDVVRSVHLGRSMNSQRDAFVATFLERFTGLLAMSLLGLCFVLSGASVTRDLSFSILIVAGIVITAATVCFFEPFAKRAFVFAKTVVAWIPSAKLSGKLLRLIDGADAGMLVARNNLPLLGKALLLSFFFHCLTVVNTYYAAKAIGWHDASIGGLFVVVPLVLIVSMVPLTPSGLGVQEGAFLFLLERIGSTHSQGLAVGLLLRAKVIFLAFVGWFLWILLKKRGSE